ncbi:hypothetical protein J6A31_07530 [bacterium]|nr:hypothetical protein [bacterium]
MFILKDYTRIKQVSMSSLKKGRFISKLFLAIGCFLLCAGVVLTIILNMNRYDTVNSYTTVESTINGVSEQMDSVQAENAVVSSLRYHPIIKIDHDGSQKTVVLNESYATKDYAESVMGELREVTYDNVTFNELVMREFDSRFVICIVAGILFIMYSMLYLHRFNSKVYSDKISVEADGESLND